MEKFVLQIFVKQDFFWIIKKNILTLYYVYIVFIPRNEAIKMLTKFEYELFIFTHS